MSRRGARQLASDAYHRFGNWYDHSHDRGRLGWLLGRFEERGIDYIDTQPLVEGTLPSGEFLVSTAGRGILHVRDGVARQLFDGRFFGIAESGGWWYGFERQRLHGRIVRFDLDGTAEVAVWGLSRGVHQLAWSHDGRRLFVMDTYHNRILELAGVDNADRVFWRTLVTAEHFPDGRLDSGRSSCNYRHFNSIKVLGDERLVVVAHNETFKTQRSSELWWSEGERWRVEPLAASNAHDVVIDEQGVWVSASIEGQLLRNGEPVFECDKFTRGVLRRDGHTVLGGSDVHFDRTNRGRSDGYLWELDENHHVVAFASLVGAPVQDIRRVAAR